MKQQTATIFQQDAKILEHEKFPENQHVIKLEVKNIANTARPGSFVHIKCGGEFSLRRPISIMRVNKVEGAVEILFKVVGKGTKYLAQTKVGDVLNLLGPIGNPFVLVSQRPYGLLIGGGVGMPPMVFLAQELKKTGQNPVAIFGSEVPFPFNRAESKLPIDNIPDTMNSGMTFLENLGIPSRCASLQDYSGVHKGYVTDLARLWLGGLKPSKLTQVAIYACGPTVMLKAAHQLAQEYSLPCQVSLEEYMACGVGGCAGCVVKVTKNGKSNMRRVCVDGPVFESIEVF